MLLSAYFGVVGVLAVAKVSDMPRQSNAAVIIAPGASYTGALLASMAVPFSSSWVAYLSLAGHAPFPTLFALFHMTVGFDWNGSHAVELGPNNHRTDHLGYCIIVQGYLPDVWRQRGCRVKFMLCVESARNNNGAMACTSMESNRTKSFVPRSVLNTTP